MRLLTFRRRAQSLNPICSTRSPSYSLSRGCRSGRATQCGVRLASTHSEFSSLILLYPHRALLDRDTSGTCLRAGHRSGDAAAAGACRASARRDGRRTYRRRREAAAGGGRAGAGEAYAWPKRERCMPFCSSSATRCDHWAILSKYSAWRAASCASIWRRPRNVLRGHWPRRTFRRPSTPWTMRALIPSDIASLTLEPNWRRNSALESPRRLTTC